MTPYVPETLPVDTLDLASLFSIVGKARSSVGRYDGALHGVVNPEVLLAPLTTTEAVLSSRIEGTQATVDELLEADAGKRFSAEKEADIEEVRNYRETLRMAADAVRSGPIDRHLML